MIWLFTSVKRRKVSQGSTHSELIYWDIANWPKDFFGDQFGEIAAMSEAALNRRE